MKNIIGFCSTVFITVLLFSCKSSGFQKALAAATGDLANIECRAFALRNQRFELANKMRFMQDSLAGMKLPEDSAKIQQDLAKLNVKKDSILTASLHLADSIKIQLDFVMTHYLTDKEKEQEFNRELDALLTKNGCK